MVTADNVRSRVYGTYASVSGLNKPLRSKYLSLQRNFRRHLAEVKGPVLDIGPGQGEMLDLCRACGLSATGWDISPEIVASCRERGLDVRQVIDLGSEIKSCPATFGAVTMIDVVEHLTRAEALDTLTLLRKHALAPGGKIMVQVPNMQSPWAHLNYFHDLTHEWAYTEASLHQLLRAAGFREVRFFPQLYPRTMLYMLRSGARALYYAWLRLCLMVDQPNRRTILTPNVIAVGCTET